MPTRRRASGSGAKPAPRPASTIPTSARSTRSARKRGALFIAMELLEGESLADRLGRGALDASEAIPIGLGHPRRALRAARPRHRPSRPEAVERVSDRARREAARLRPGPARARRRRTAWPPADADRHRDGHAALHGARAGRSASRSMLRSDLFAAGAILFEMLAGRPAFAGRSLVDVLHATRYEQPPALAGSPAVAAVDRVIRRAMAKRPADRPARPTRWPRSCARSASRERRPRPRPRADPARRAAVPGPAPRSRNRLPRLQPARRHRHVAVRHRSLIVRSSAVAARFAGDTPDLKALAAEADVDRVVMGTLLRAGDQLRATAAARRRAGRHAADVAHRPASLGDLFRCRTTSPGASPRRWRCRSPARRRRRPTPRSARLRALPARQRARADLRGPRRGA